MRNIISKFFFTLLALTLGFSQMWAAYDVLFNGYSSTTKADYYKSYTIDTKTVTVESSQSISSSSGDYYVQLGSAASDASTNYISVVANDFIDSVSFLMTGNGADKALIPALLCWNTAYDSSNKTYADSAIVHASQTVSAKGFANAQWVDFDISESSFKEVRVFKQAKNIVVKTAAKANFPASGAQTLQVYGVRIKLRPAAATAPAITAPTTDQSATYTIGDAITALEVTATGSPTPTYQWYYNSSASTEGATSLGSGAQTASYTPDNSVASDLYYYCVATNSAGSATSPYFHVTVSTPSTPAHDITYTNTKGADNSSNPTEFYEGVGVASFDPLADVADFHFTGWSPASIATDATTDQVIDAQWVAAYNVTFALGGATGTAPDAFQKWEGATFNLPGQGSMVAPDGKAFDGWKANGAGAKLAADAEYTMGNADVEFVAQWKATPTTLYSLTVTNTSNVNLANGGTQNDLADDATIVGGGAYMQNDHASKEQQILASTKLQFKAGTVTLVMTLNNALKEGDTIKATGLNQSGLCFGITFDRAANLTNAVASDASYFLVPAAFEGATTLYAWRVADSGTTCSSITIIRPAAREIASTVITLSDVKVNDHSISSDSLDMLKVGPAYSLTLKDSYAAAPEIKFNEHTVITYVEGLPATKETDKVYTVTAAEVAGNWQAQQTINAITYIVNATKVSAATVSYYDGATKLGEEIVAVGGNPADYATYQTKQLATFDGWYNDPDLAVGHEIADIATLTVDADMNVYGKWTNRYASSVNIEQWTLDNGKGGTDAEREVQMDALVSLLGTRGFASNIAYEKSNIELDSLNDDPSKTNRNYAYLGLKVKSAGKMLDLRLANTSVLKVKFGNVGTTPKVSINGAAYEDMTITENVYTYTATGDDYVSIKTADGKAVVFQQIMIDEPIAPVALPWKVTFDAATNGGTCTTESLSGTSVTLPDATPASGFTFKGWYDAATDGNKIGDASDSYSPTDNITLYAQFDAIVPVKDLVRDGLSNGKWGTLCPKQTVENVEGATFYQISYLEEKAGMPFNMYFDEIGTTTLTAGQPYFFIATGEEIRGNKTGAELDAAGAGVNGLYGYIGATSWELPYYATYDPAQDNTFVIHDNSVYWINEAGTMLRSERCYIKINATVPSRTAYAPMPGRDRIRMSIAGVSVVTGMEEITNDQSQMANKVIIDGRLFILRGEKMYDATGRQVK